MNQFLFWFSLFVLILGAGSISYALSVVRSHSKTLDLLNTTSHELNHANFKCALYELRVSRTIGLLELLTRLNRSGAQKLPTATLTVVNHLIAFLSTPIAGDDSRTAAQDDAIGSDSTRE